MYQGEFDQPAFPQLAHPVSDASGAICGFQGGGPGMSLRDYFAASALQSVSCGIIAEANHGTTPESLAVAAYSIADAMMTARLTSPAGAPR